MRFVVELSDGVTSKVGLTGPAGAGSGTTSFSQALTQVKDLLQATKVDVGVQFYAVTTNASTDATGPRLYIESSMQNEDASNALWEPVHMGDDGYLNLRPVSAGTLPAQMTWTVMQDFGRYLRWRIEIPEAATAVTLTLIFKVTLLGHG
jgi:hypothetical protein